MGANRSNNVSDFFFRENYMSSLYIFIEVVPCDHVKILNASERLEIFFQQIVRKADSNSQGDDLALIVLDLRVQNLRLFSIKIYEDSPSVYLMFNF